MAKILTEAGTVQCTHGGKATPSNVSSKVKVNQSGVAFKPKDHNVSGCSYVPPAGKPCSKASWIKAATKVKINGDPVLLEDSKSSTDNGFKTDIPSAQTGSGTVKAK